AIAMFLSVVILGRFTTETHAMALYISTDTPPLFTPRPGTFPSRNVVSKTCFTVPRRQVKVLGNGLMSLFPFAGGTATPPRLDQDNGRIRAAPNSLCSKEIGKPTGPSTSMT
ncbi:MULTISPECIES: hypothetical protein, partial [Mycobacterium avium complex (MAC)]